MTEETCKHIKSANTKVKPKTPGECAKCVEMGDEWVHLRLCLTCGNVGCCNDSKNKHATKHFIETDHPVIMSHEPGESWKFCYPDDLFVE